MLRIDENTLIDDSLVTCAEYQLYIDGLRTLGYYRQPDHWTSYQFSAGESRLPILGIRHSDAQTFCDWLTHREGGVWRYRIPTSKEATEYPLPPSTICPLGYWTSGTDEQTEFAWVGPVPVNPRALAYAIAHTHAPLLDLARFLDNNRDLAHYLAHTRAINLDRDRALDLGRFLDLDIARAFYLDLDRALNLDRALDRDRDLDRVRDLAIEIALEIDIKYVDLREFFFGIYIDLFTLTERIAGRSPAFEGLRLVKERDVSDR